MSTSPQGRSPRARLIVGIAATTAVIAGSLVVATTTASADSGKGPKVTICHATSSETNPYTVNTVDTSSIANLVDHNGHGLHENDIIPSFTDRRGEVYPGLNWNTVGWEIYAEGTCDGESEGGGEG